MNHSRTSPFSVKAFSLVELSIVLIIIGLLVAGVSGGSKMISNAKLRTVISDMEQYKLAVNTFKGTYDELPGDMKDSSALDFFGVTHKARNGSNPVNDGFIGGSEESSMAFWHMSLAELIFGEYNGVYAIAEVPGINVGKAKFSKNSGFHFFTLGVTSNRWGYGSSSVYLKTHKNVLTFGNVRTGDSYTLGESALTPAQAYNIDKKKDDGLPHSGKIMADHGLDVGSNNQCINYAKIAADYISSDSPLAYKLDNQDPACRMMFEL